MGSCPMTNVTSFRVISEAGVKNRGELPPCPCHINLTSFHPFLLLGPLEALIGLEITNQEMTTTVSEFDLHHHVFVIRGAHFRGTSHTMTLPTRLPYTTEIVPRASCALNSWGSGPLDPPDTESEPDRRVRNCGDRQEYSPLGVGNLRAVRSSRRSSVANKTV
jgi:hypothetical protein